MSEPTVTRKLTAIFYADIADYSRLTGVDEAGTHQAAMATLDLAAKTIQQNGGSVLRYAGDAILAEFSSVTASIESAVRIQSELGECNQAISDDKAIRIRIGINLGEVLADRGEIYGEGVNLAARLESIAEPGGLCVSQAVYDQVAQKSHISFAHGGTVELKNIAKPVPVYHWHPTMQSENFGATSVHPDLPDKPSIAVLPFDNMSNDPEQAFFADGISEDIITQLSHFHSLFVIARNSSFAFRDQALDIKEIGKSLGVQYIVEGSVRRAGNRARITAQLIDAHSDQHIWAEKYDRDLEDIFEVQDEVTRAIVSAIEPTLESKERQRARQKPPENLGAWESYQRGLWHLYQYTAEDYAEAVAFLNRAIDMDPSFSSAYAGLAFALYYGTILGFADDSKLSLEAAHGAGLQAVKLDENNAYAHVCLGRVLTVQRKYLDAIARCEHAIKLNPSFANAHFGRAHGLWMHGRPADAIVSHDEAMRLSPRDPLMWAFMGSKAMALILLGRYEEAVEWSRKGQHQPNTAIWAFLPEVSALALSGRIDEARAAFERVRNMKPDVSIEFIDSAIPIDKPNDRDHFLGGLLAAGLSETA